MTFLLLASLALGETACADIASCAAACDAGQGEACAKVGDIWADADARQVAEYQAVLAWSKACTKGHDLGCFRMSQARAEGRGLPADQRAADESYEQLCSTDHFVPACIEQLGGAVRDGNAEQIRELGERTAGYATGNCREGTVEDCFAGAAVYQAVLDDMRTGKEASNTLRAGFQKVCERGEAWGCWELGFIAAKGKRPVPGDAAYQRKTRDTVLLGPLDPVASTRWYERGDELALFDCRAGEMGRCNELFLSLRERDAGCHPSNTAACREHVKATMVSLCEADFAGACR